MSAIVHHIYYTYYHTPLPHRQFRELLELLPGPMQQKIQRLRRWQDAHAAVLGKHLLLHALKQAGNGSSLEDLRYNEFKRPYLEGFPDFNISHAGNLVVCAVSGNGRIGIDVEERRPLDITDFTNLFSAVEWQAINQAMPPLDRFYYYWTAKEAILKADGRGLIDNLHRLAVDHHSAVPLDGHTWHLQQLYAFENYTCHVAGSDASAVWIPEDVTLQIGAHAL